MNIEFLQSERFWALIIGSASAVLIDPNFPIQQWYISVGKFFGLVAAGFIGIGTIDRVGKNIGGVKPSVTEFEEEQKEK